MRPIRIAERISKKTSTPKSNSKPKNIRFVDYQGRKYIIYNWNNETIRDRIIIVPHERRVGSWERVIRIDDDIPEKHAKALALHESVEKRLMKKGYSYPEAHRIALKYEHDYCRSKNINIRRHEQIVRRVREREERI